MAATPLGLYDLLRPSFLMGFTVPAHIDRYLSVLGIEELRAAHDDFGVVYVGTATFVGDGEALPVREHRDPNGSVIRFDESLTVDFRLSLPRDGSAGIDVAVDALASQSFTELRDLFDLFGPVEQVGGTPTEYPGYGFRLELLFNTITLHLSRETWVPGMLSADHRIVPDPERANEDVRFVLPNMVFVYEQGDDPNQPPSFRLRSWGNAGFSAPSDLQAGELVRMEPPIAAAKSGRWGFGVDQVLIDLSSEHTPPEILQFYGTDEAFEGLYIKEARLFYSDSDKDFGLNTAVRDVLISTSGEVSLEASIDLLFGPGAEMNVEVKIFDGNTEIKHEGATAAKPVAIPDNAVAQVHITGGVPTFDVSVKIGSSETNSVEIWDGPTRLAPISPSAPATVQDPGPTNLFISVSDSTPGSGQQEFDLTIPVLVRSSDDESAEPDGAPADRRPNPDDPLEADFTITQPASDGRNLHRDAQGGTSERFRVEGRDVDEVRVNGVPTALDEAQSFTIDVPPGSDSSPIQIEVDWAARAAPETIEFPLYFVFARPTPAQLSSFIGGSGDPDQILQPRSTVLGLQEWAAQIPPGSSVKIDGHASYDADNDVEGDLALSERRRAFAAHILGTGVTITGNRFGQSEAKQAGRAGDRDDRRVTITAELGAAAPAETLIATISREERDTTTPADPTPKEPPNPPQPQNKKPNFLRRLGFRTRIERNVPSLLELSGQVDFETDLEESLRNATGEPSQTLDLQTTPEASQSPVEDGVVDFVLQVTHDTATFEWLERIQLGAADADQNGLVRMTNARGNGAGTRFKDTFGAVLTFAPVINETASELDPESVGDWAALGLSLGVPVAIGATSLFQTHAVTLYGGELQARQYIPPTEDATFNDAAVLFDYGVEFGLDIGALGIQTTKPLKVRYKALGFRLKFPDGVQYEPVFDTSRGYEIDLSDPSLLSLPAPLGNVLKLLSARIARFNPLTLEVDLGLKVDLGVVTVDRFKIKWPLDPLGAPMILPTGVKVDIPSTIVGSGSLNIRDSGFDGTLDVSLVPLKLRVAGSLGIEQLEDAATGREATGVFVGLIVDFPAPIVLGTSGLGLYGLSGLFGMHYKRLEPAAVPGDAAGPALRWLKLAEGEPSRLTNSSNVPLWGPEFDKWSFGIGAVLGTTEGGFLANFRGTVVVELPGPRVLIFIKAQFLVPLPGLSEDTEQLDAGLLGVLDLDFHRRQITVGMLVNLEIVDIIKIEIPIEVFFKYDDPSNWHVYLGTLDRPVSATVLNLVRGRGYFMIDGADIANFPGPNGPITLPAIAVATGLEASLILGSEDIGLYLKVAAGAHIGVAFSPFFIVGRIYLSGELRLFIVSIEATGELSVEAPDPTIIRGEICGKVSFFFFSVKGCVGLTVGSGTHALPAPPLVRNLYLQSFAPVLTAGQAGDRPIDGSLGDAVPVGDGAVLPVVPIDSVPVLQLHASPLVDQATFFSESPGVSPDLTVGGWIEAGGGRRIRYELKSVEITPPLPASSAPVPATWRTILETGPKGAKTDIDLALFSREPTATARALERSTELDGQVSVQWEGLCDEIAPPACVLWTFCDEKLGPSGDGWHRTGIPWPDPPDTVRGAPVPDHLYVEEPETDPLDELLDLGLYEAGANVDEPAEIIGSNVPCDREEPGKPGICVTFPKKETGPNPLQHQGLRFLVRDFRGVPAANTKLNGSLDCGHSLEIDFPRATRRVDLHLLTLSGRPGRVTAFDKNGSVVAKADKPAPVAVVQLEAPGIRRIVVESPQNETRLFRLCYQGLPILDFDPGEILGGEIATTLRGRNLLSSLRTRLAARRERANLALRDSVRALEEAGPAQPPLSNFAELFRRHPRTHLPDELRATNPERLNPCCFRALELPRKIGSGIAEPSEFEVTADIAKRRDDKLFVTLHTNRAKVVRIFLAVSRNLLTAGGLRVRQLDGAGQLIVDEALADLTTTPISGTINGLPAPWVDPMGPWREQVLPVAAFIAAEARKTLARVLLTLEPKENCEQIQLLIPPGSQADEQESRAIVAVVEVCSLHEEERAQNDSSIRTGRIETATGFLQSNANVPLLEPNRTYTLRARYDAITDPGDGEPHETETNLEQAFRFRTDNRPPERLDPWVVATSPRHEDRYHFFEDPIRLIFNDDSLLQLYEAYGRQLRVVVRAADGIPLPGDRIETLDPVEAELSTPYRDFLEALVEAGLLPCVGEITTPTHGSFTVPVTLRPLMDYTLDVVMDPELAPADPEAPIVPLFRRSFSTGRFAAPKDLVKVIVEGFPRHRALDNPLSDLPTAPGVHVLEDQLIQDALVRAGESAVPSANVPGITIYWVRNATGDHYVPHALLIDSPEPLWRQREEPVLETVPGQDDPAYQRIVPGNKPSLEIFEQSANRVARFIHSPAATRTLVMLAPIADPPATVPPLSLALRQPASVLHQATERVEPLIELPLGAFAPWETEE